LPNIKSAKKRVKIAEMRRKRNKGIKTRLKNITTIIKGESDPEKARELLKVGYSLVDKAVKKGVIHKNKAIRKKSQFARLVREK